MEQSTPDLGNNLALWHSPVGNDTDYPCCYQKVSWQGVSCLTYTFNSTSGDQKTWVIGLSLIGNRNLTGSLPTTLQYLPLTTLDLHDNNFYGDIPAELQKLYNLQTLDLRGNQLSGPFPYEQFDATRALQYYSIARNHLSGSIPDGAFENLTSLTFIDLSGNSFCGPLPDFSMLHKLKYLYLDNNAFNGTLNITRWSTLNFSSQNSNSSTAVLQSVSLTNNNITDVIFELDLIQDVKTIINLQGNPYCTSSKDVNGVRCYCQQKCSLLTVAAHNGNMPIIGGVGGSIFLVVVVGILISVWCVEKRRRVTRFARRNMKALGNMKDFFSNLPCHGKTATLYSLRALEKATKNFADELILGEGGFGTVYKGMLDSGVAVAIKKTNHVDTNGSQQFLNEVSVLSQVNHLNLVRLHGCCVETEVPMLVYEYVPIKHCLSTCKVTAQSSTWGGTSGCKLPLRQLRLLGTSTLLHIHPFTIGMSRHPTFFWMTSMLQKFPTLGSQSL